MIFSASSTSIPRYLTVLSLCVSKEELNSTWIPGSPMDQRGKRKAMKLLIINETDAMRAQLLRWAD